MIHPRVVLIVRAIAVCWFLLMSLALPLIAAADEGAPRSPASASAPAQPSAPAPQLPRLPPVQRPFPGPCFPTMEDLSEALDELLG